MPKPLVKICYFTEPYCDYPTMVKIPMDDGKAMPYVLQNKTDIQLQKIFESMAKLRQMAEGYQYKGRHRFRKNKRPW